MTVIKLKNAFHSARKTIFSALVNALHSRIQTIPLNSSSAGISGFVEEVTVANSRIQIKGWASAQKLRFSCAGIQRTVTPDQHREDLNDIPKHCNFRAAGFEVDLPFGPELEVEFFSAGRWKVITKLPTVSRTDWVHAAFQIARILLRIGFTRPRMVFKYFMFSDKFAAGELERMLLPPTTNRSLGRIPDDLFMKVPHARNAGEEIVIIVPVYNAFELLQVCLDRVVSNSDMAFELVVVEDASTDTRVKPWLRDWCSKQTARVNLIENPKNLGFISSVSEVSTRGTDLRN